MFDANLSHSYNSINADVKHHLARYTSRSVFTGFFAETLGVNVSPVLRNIA
jgi:hypothetical protein